MTMCSQLLTIKRYTICVLVKHSIDSEAATETTLAGLKQTFFFFCSEVDSFCN